MPRNKKVIRGAHAPGFPPASASVPLTASGRVLIPGGSRKFREIFAFAHSHALSLITNVSYHTFVQWIDRVG